MATVKAKVISKLNGEECKDVNEIKPYLNAMYVKLSNQLDEVEELNHIDNEKLSDDIEDVLNDVQCTKDYINIYFHGMRDIINTYHSENKKAIRSIQTNFMLFSTLLGVITGIVIILLFK